MGHRTVRRIGTRAAIVLPYVLMSAGHVVLAALPVAAVVAVAGFVTGAAITVWNVVTVSLRQQLVAPERFGRVNSVYRWLGTGAGKVIKMGHTVFNIYAEGQYTLLHEGNGQPATQVFIGFNAQFVGG